MFNKWKRRYKELEKRIRLLENQIPNIYLWASQGSDVISEVYWDGYRDAVSQLDEILVQHNQSEDMGIDLNRFLMD